MNGSCSRSWYPTVYPGGVPSPRVWNVSVTRRGTLRARGRVDQQPGAVGPARREQVVEPRNPGHGPSRRRRWSPAPRSSVRRGRGRARRRLVGPATRARAPARARRGRRPRPRRRPPPRPHRPRRLARRRLHDRSRTTDPHDDHARRAARVRRRRQAADRQLRRPRPDPRRRTSPSTTRCATGSPPAPR